jgi:hypothetical protein
MVNVPVVAVGDATKVRVEVPVAPEARVTVTGLKLAVVPLGDADAERVMVPLKPFNDVRVMVDVAEEPCRTVTELGDALMLKSGFTVVTVRA